MCMYILHCNLAGLLLKISVFSAPNLAYMYLREPFILKYERSREEIPHCEREEPMDHPVLKVIQKKMHLRQSLICIGKKEQE